MPGSHNYGSASTISSYNLILLLSLLLGCISIVKSSPSTYSSVSGDVSLLDSTIQIPDHQGYTKKLYYYRLPISSVKLGQIKHLNIKEVDKDSLPEWLILRKEKDRWELIGFPQDQDKGIHFLQIEIVNKDNTKIADVFTIEITNTSPSYQTYPSSSSTTLSSSSSASSSITNGGSKGNCIIRVLPKCDSILDVWKIISYLIPFKLKQEIDLSAKLVEYTNNLEEIDDPNILMNQWSQHLFVVTQTAKQEKDSSRKYSLTIENQECEIGKIESSSDSYGWKLKKLGLEFHHIQLISTPSSFDGVDRDDDGSFVEGVNPSKAYSNSFVPVSINNDDFAALKKHNRRDLPNIAPTPSLYPDFMTISSTISNLDDYKIESSTMSREVPTLTSPSAFPSSSVYSDVFTPLMPDISNNNNNNNFVGVNEIPFHPVLYTTPTPTIEPPSVFEGLSTPTPILPSVKLSDLSSILRPDIDPLASSFDLISPTATLDIHDITKNHVDEPIIFEGTNKVSTDHKPEPRPEVTGNNRPELRNRIQKLAPVAGKYWTFKIPVNTFVDREDGSTDKLSLGFHRVSSSSKNQLDKDFWIQFNAENQELTAFPTDDDVGVYENQFFLEAVDSGGLATTENITIHVRQHTSYRKFPYNITFYRVFWDPLKITTTIEALKNFAQIIGQVNGDYNGIKSFVVQHLSKETIDGKDYWTIVATNDSIPAYPCPIKTINQLFNRYASKNSKGPYALPSELLTSKINKMFTLEGVGLSISCQKTITAAEKPQLRNPIEQLRFRLGEVFRYKIAENMFYTGRGRNTYNLELTLYDVYGRVPPSDSFVKFNEKTFEIIGLADDRRYVRENEFNLVARDRVSKTEASDAFVISIDDPWNEEEISFTVTFGISLNDKMDIDDKLDIAHQIATKIFNDPDTSSLRILKIVKRNFTLIPTSIDSSKNPNLSDADEDENNIESRRRKRSDSYDNSIDEGSMHSMYEYVWTNKTGPVLVGPNGECPSTSIQDAILGKLFHPENDFDFWDEKFGDKYRVMSIEFKPAGKCSNYITSREMYRDDLKPIIIPEKDIKSQPDETVNYGQPASKDYEIHTNELDDYYLRTIIPAIGTVAILLVVLCVIVCILVKCRRDIDKNRFDMPMRPGIDGYSSEVDAFIQKGRRPVILQSDYQQHMPMNSMMVTYNPVGRQQTYSMANVNKNSYHALAHAVDQQRRQPPPYR